jgi:hypothetical protein
MRALHSGQANPGYYALREKRYTRESSNPENIETGRRTRARTDGRGDEYARETSACSREHVEVRGTKRAVSAKKMRVCAKQTANSKRMESGRPPLRIFWRETHDCTSFLNATDQPTKEPTFTRALSSGDRISHKSMLPRGVYARKKQRLGLQSTPTLSSEGLHSQVKQVKESRWRIATKVLFYCVLWGVPILYGSGLLKFGAKWYWPLAKAFGYYVGFFGVLGTVGLTIVTIVAIGYAIVRSFDNSKS